ncbi:MAG: thermonuclease family protein [Bradymonadaceae bacterium]
MPDTSPFYWYKGRLVESIDGDTFDLQVDLGFRIEKQIRLRLKGISTSEIYGVDEDSEEYKQGIAALERADEMIKEWQDTSHVAVRTEGEEGAYGRWLGDIYSPGRKHSLSRTLLDEGLAQKYDSS